MKLHLGRPTGRRKSFRILSQNGSKFETVKHPDLAAINKSLAAGKVDLEAAEKNVRELIKKLGPKRAPTIHNNDNYKIYENYWEAEYSHRPLKDPESERHALKRAISALKNVSLQSATREEIQKQINSEYKDNSNKQRRIAQKVNQFLKWIGRDFTLALNKEDQNEVKYLTLEEFGILLKKLDEPYKTLHEVCFYGGFRIGEAFALDSNLLNETTCTISVMNQVDKKGKKRKTKTGRNRVAFIIPDGISTLKSWFSIRHEIPLNQRKNMAKITHKACQAAFPGNDSKNLTFHDLRHCYVIYLLGKGIPTKLIAESIGDSERVLEKHYAGYILATDGIKLMHSLLTSSKTSK